MKLSLIALTVSCANAFTTRQPVSSASTSALNLFGSGGDKAKAGGGGGGAGMMDQLAMFKKAQEMAQKKKLLDEELMKEVFVGEGEDGKVKGTFKYVPISNPMDPNPDYEATKFEFDDDFFESASAEELSAAIKASIQDGIEKTNTRVAEKYTVLQKDLMEALGGAKKE